MGLNHITHKIERVRASEEEALAGVSTVDLPRPVAGDGAAAASEGEGAEGGERANGGRPRHRPFGGRERGARHARPPHFDCGPPWLADGRTGAEREGEGALRDERLDRQRESGGTGRLQLVHYN